MLCIFSRAYWLSVFLWRNVFIHSSGYFRSSASFLIGLFCYCWVVWIVCIFRRLSSCCLHDLQIFSPVLYKVTFSLTYGFLCCEHCFFDHIPLHRTQDFHAQSKSSSRSHETPFFKTWFSMYHILWSWSGYYCHRCEWSWIKQAYAHAWVQDCKDQGLDWMEK